MPAGTGKFTPGSMEESVRGQLGGRERNLGASEAKTEEYLAQ